MDDHLPRRADARLLALIVMAGVVCRVVQYLWCRSYWHDEAFLVFTISEGTFSDAFGPLRMFQSTPPLFLMLQMIVRRMLGDGEYALRLVPLFLGCASVGLMAALARRLASPLTAILATAMFALSDRLIWHTVESKQYTGDVFCALVLLLIATGGPMTLRRFGVVSAFSAAAVWFSHPIVFLFSGVSLAVFVSTSLARTRSAFVAFAALNAAVGVSIGALYWFVLRDQQYPYLFEYWNEQMVPWTEPSTLPAWFGKMAFDLFDYPYEKAGYVLMPLAVVGAVSLRRRGDSLIVGLLLWPAVMNFLAAALHRYPFSGTRATLYLAPALLLLPAIGCESLVRKAVSPAWRRAAICLPAVLIVFGLVQASYRLVIPRHRGHIREPAAFLVANYDGDDPVYILGETSPAEFYLRGIPTKPILIGDIGTIRDPSFWLIYSYSTQRTLGTRRLAVDDLARAASIDKAFETTGGAAFRFTRTR